MARDALRFDPKTKKIKLPMVLVKTCTHGSGPELELRLRGDMGFEIDTFAGHRQEVYICIQCGNTRPAAELFEQMQAYILTGQDFSIGRQRVVP